MQENNFLEKKGPVESLFLILERRELKLVENLIILEGYHYENKQKNKIVAIAIMLKKEKSLYYVLKERKD